MGRCHGYLVSLHFAHTLLLIDYVAVNLVPRSLEDEAEGEIWPNPICIT